MSRIVFDRLREICPDKSAIGMEYDDLLSDCKTAFEIIGYDPKNLENSFGEVCESVKKSGNDLKLYEFIFNVWRFDE